MAESRDQMSPFRMWKEVGMLSISESKKCRFENHYFTTTAQVRGGYLNRNSLNLLIKEPISTLCVCGHVCTGIYVRLTICAFFLIR